MKLLYLAFIRIPTEKAHGVQIMKTCEAFAGTGIQVELMVPGRKTPIMEDPFFFYGAKKNFILTKLGGIDVVSWGTLGFILSALWFSEKAKLTKSFWEADIIYSRDAFVLLQYILLGKKLVYEAHTKPTSISAFVAKRVNKLIVISEGLRDAYIKLGIAPEKIVVAHDAFDPVLFEKYCDQKETRELLNIPTDKKIALYVGRIDIPKGAETFAAVSKRLPPEWVTVLIGEGPSKAELQKKYSQALFLPGTPYREISRVLGAADVLVLPNSDRDKNASLYTSPLKAFAYLASQKPIVVSDVPALKAIFGEDVVFFTAGDLDSLEQGLYKAFSQGERKDNVNGYTWGNRAKIILKAISV